jgi:short subunit dehydrogenase-like uncharacterized protein
VRRSARAFLVGVARDDKGESVRSRLTTPEEHTLTSMTAVEIAKRVASGNLKLGFQTPSLVYGADNILGFDGVTREEMNKMNGSPALRRSCHCSASTFAYRPSSGPINST